MSEKIESKNENEKEEIDTSKKEKQRGRIIGRQRGRGNLSNTRQVNSEENNFESSNNKNNENNDNNDNKNNVGRRGRNFPMRRNYNNQRLRRQNNNYQRNYNYNNYIRQRRGLFRRRNYNYNQRNNYYKYQRTNNLRKLYVSNLDSKITGHELNQIFSRIGKLTRCFINYDKLGTSLRSAFVDYENPRDARRALNQFDDTKIGRDYVRVTYKRVRRYNRSYPRIKFNYNQNNNNNNNMKRRIVFRRRF